jgi:hypothetical protein
MAIVKILSRHSPSYASLIQYILRYIGNQEKTDQAQMYTNNLRSSDIAGYVREFIENEAIRRYPRADQVHLFHEIVSFADEDREGITPVMIDELAHEYMRLRGNTSVMIGAPHFDKNHVHLHFCVSALHYRTGMSNGLNKQQLRELKQSFQAYHKQRFPELDKSLPAHGRGGISLTHRQWHARQREQIVQAVQHCFDRATSQNEFLNLLRDAQLHHYERNGKPTGIEYEGAKFRFSRLLEDRQLEALPVERSEEELALEAIRAVREWQQGRDEQSRDIEDRELDAR